MNLRTHLYRQAPRHAQAGATLMVAIMMLLIITLLALSSMRGVSLESRITGNLKLQKTLTGAAEAGLRMGERSIRYWNCTGTGDGTDPNFPAPCISTLTLNPNASGDYPAQFTAANQAKINIVSAGYGGVKIQWYITDLRYVGTQTRNSCGVGGTGCGRKYYEITSCASMVLCSADTTTQRVIVRSVFSVPST